jgi:two-component system heavy metal sensor histidine kinase CusS
VTSLRARLTVNVVAIVAIVLVAFASLLYVAARRAAWQQHDDGLTGRAHAIAASAEYDDDGYEVGLPAESTAYIEVWRPDGTVLARSRLLGSGDLGKVRGFADVDLPDGRRGRAVGLAFAPRAAPSAGAGELSLVLADGTEDVDAAVASVRTAFLVLALAALAAIAALTAWSVSRGLRPLARLARELDQIDDRHLTARLATSDQPRELRTAVRKLEELLLRLDASLVRERQFTADVSHELRTPLAGLRTVLEVGALSERSPAEYRATLADALAIVTQVTTMVENLLTLARAEAGQLEVAASEVSVRAFVDQCWGPHAELAAKRAIEFRNTIASERTVRTDPEQLRIVVANLLANAAEYTEPGGWIEVRSADGVVLDVTDSGPAIPGDQLERIFERFVRADTARAATGTHCGIGLSLSRAICSHLQLSLGAASSPEGRVSFQIGYSSSTNLPSSVNVASLRPESVANPSS